MTNNETTPPGDMIKPFGDFINFALIGLAIAAWSAGQFPELRTIIAIAVAIGGCGISFFCLRATRKLAEHADTNQHLTRQPASPSIETSALVYNSPISDQNIILSDFKKSNLYWLSSYSHREDSNDRRYTDIINSPLSFISTPSNEKESPSLQDSETYEVEIGNLTISISNNVTNIKISSTKGDAHRNPLSSGKIDVLLTPDLASAIKQTH